MADSQPQDLLEYISQYRILICTECRYAIQPAAISRHLKELHHIYRHDRKQLLDSIVNLELADPVDVGMPPVDSLPVKSLPVEDGVACNFLGCGHLCVTIKRMKRHWVTEHGTPGVEPTSWRSVKLQTFFRGTELRYFVVSLANTFEQQSNSYTKDKSRSISEPSDIEPYPNLTILPTSNIEDTNTRLLDHYIAITYKTLVQREEGPEFWRTNILQIARDHSFVMHGLLAISALHMAWLDPNQRSETDPLLIFNNSRRYHSINQP